MTETDAATGAMLTWDEAFLAGTSRAGGKGWHLSRFCRYGFAVPRGGVLSAAVYAEMFAAPDIAAQVTGVRRQDTHRNRTSRVRL